jgi:hypothetical protein
MGLILLVNVAGASVTYSNYYEQIEISNEPGITNLTQLREKIVDQFGNEFADTVIYETSPKHWNVHAIYVKTPNTLYINDTDAEQVSFRTSSNGWAYKGYIEFENVALISSNGSINPGYGLSYNKANDVTFKNFKNIYFGYKYGNSISNLEFFNLTLEQTKYGLSFQNANNIKVHDILVKDGDRISGGGLLLCEMNNSLIYNVQVINASEKSKDATAAYGVQLAGSNNIIHDVYIDYVAYSGTSFTGGVNLTAYNIKVIDAGHNGFEVEMNDSKFTNIYIKDSHRHNLFQVGKGEIGATRGNNIYEQVTSINSDIGYGACITEGSFDTIIANSTFVGKGPYVSNSKNVTLLNVVQSDALGTGAEGAGFLSTIIDGNNFAYLDDISIIDSDFSSNSWNDLWINDGATKIINTKYSTVRLDHDNFSDGYYLDMIILDSNGNTVSKSNIEFNEVNNFIETSNGMGMDMSSFVVDSNGRTYLPQFNRAQSPVLSGSYKEAGLEAITLSNKATVTSPTGDTVTLTDITPDSTWYREDPNTPTYTITAIIPDASSTSPQITGFAPSSDNPFTAGESRKFQVWTDQELTTMKWYVNGNLVSSGSMDYTWKVLSGTNTIMFSGSNANGGVVQTWEVTEGDIVNEGPVSSGTGLSFTPSATSLTATTGESTTFSVDTTQEFTSAVWSVDGTEVETGTTGHVEAWTTAGTHTVTFDGTAAAGTISRSWTVVVSAAAESEYSSISISPSTTTVAPGESFSLDVYIDPTQALTGSQFDLQYSQLASISTVDEGDLFTASGLATTFQYDSISNAEGLLDNVYAAIVGSGTITSPDVMATIEMVAGSSSGILNIGLSDVILSDVNSNPAGYTVSNATVLIDTAPQFISVPSQTVVEGQSLSFTVSATDADADELTYTATTLPSGATFNGGSFSWTPSEGDAGSYVASFEVTDGYLTDTVNVSITVTPLNHMPEITLFEPADSSVFEEGSTIEVNVAANDADGDSLSYLIEIDGVQVSTSFSYSWTTDYESAGTHTIKVTISDGTEEVSSSSTITITDLQPRWDVNEDGIVNVLDITLVGQNYGKTYTTELPRWDVNQDSTVNIQDLSIVSGHFGETV